jgi:hypothetical protein
MRRAIAMLLILAVLATGISVAAGQVKTDTPNVSAERVQELIDALGSNRFADRERASKELDALGPFALKQLRQALKSSDGEICRRAELLVRKIEDRQLTAALLVPKRVHVNVKDVAVAEAVAELARQSGYPIHLVGDLSALADRKVTLDTGDATFWEALEQLSAQARLVETVVTNYAPNFGQPNLVQPIKGKGGKGGKKGGFGGAGLNQVATPPAGILLTAGQPLKTPTFLAGSVRIRLLRATTLPNREIEVVLEVRAEPRLDELGSGGPPRLDKAIDDQAQKLTSVLLPPADNNLANGLNGFGNGNLVISGTSMPGSAGIGGPYQITLRLMPGPAAAKALKELSGKLSVQTMVDADPDIVVVKILQAAGQSAKGKEGKTLHVRQVEQLADGHVRIQVAMENAPGQGMGGFGNVNGNVVIIQNGNNIVIAGGPNNPTASSSALPRLLDATGKSFSLVQQSSPSLTITGNQVFQIVTLLYQPQAGQGPATQLVLPGQRLFTFAVPFAFENVVLR